MSQQQPLKRNENLVKFSHEHHHGLVFCTRLKKAKQARPETVKAYVKDFWEVALARHFEKEEELLLPLMGDHELTQRFLSEHSAIKALVNDLLSSDGDAVTDRALTLAQLANDHIRFEERQLFPWLEQKLDPAQLQRVGHALESVEVACHNFKPEFWKQ